MERSPTVSSYCGAGPYQRLTVRHYEYIQQDINITTQQRRHDRDLSPTNNGANILIYALRPVNSVDAAIVEERVEVDAEATVEPSVSVSDLSVVAAVEPPRGTSEREIVNEIVVNEEVPEDSESDDDRSKKLPPVAGVASILSGGMGEDRPPSLEERSPEEVEGTVAENVIVSLSEGTENGGSETFVCAMRGFEDRAFPGEASPALQRSLAHQALYQQLLERFLTNSDAVGVPRNGESFLYKAGTVVKDVEPSCDKVPELDLERACSMLPERSEAMTSLSSRPDEDDDLSHYVSAIRPEDSDEERPVVPRPGLEEAFSEDVPAEERFCVDGTSFSPASPKVNGKRIVGVDGGDD
ncbi:hypothetical protein BBJ28_00017006 [Nothophytophthora sp. Chile5]|nr:hypothetical protein BBJ28_00017006 [Nothophytophthora sp. Chile5]